MAVPTSGLVLWLKADSGVYQDAAGTTPVTADGQPVGRWADAGGSGNHVVQATSGMRPTYKAGIVHGRPVVRFDPDASSSLATAASAAPGIGTGDFWFACVHSWTGGRFFSTALSIGDGNLSFSLPCGTQPAVILSGTHAFSPASPDTWYLAEMGRVGGRLEGWISSAGALPAKDPATYAATDPVDDAGMAVGMDAWGGNYYGGDVAEILLYGRSLTAGEKSDLESYLVSKYWGVGASSMYLRQSTAVSLLVGPVLDAAGLPVTTAVIGDFSAFKGLGSAPLAAPATSTHAGNGHYTLLLPATAADTLGQYAVWVNNAAYAMPPARYLVIDAASYDELVTGTLAPPRTLDAIPSTQVTVSDSRWSAVVQAAGQWSRAPSALVQKTPAGDVVQRNFVLTTDSTGAISRA